MVKQDRSLEVIVLAGRGLSSKLPSGSRRKVQLTLISTRDPDGEAFGAKVSPWTEAAGRERALRFGASGLKCSFPLSGRRGAPSFTSDPRFADTAHLRVRIFASSVSTNNSVIQTAAALLPTSVVQAASKEVDEATAQLEAEVSVPLTNIVSGRVGHAADRALGGWVPLHCCLDDDDEGPLKDELPPALWMQMYVLPDHVEMVPKLQAQLLEVTNQPSTAAASPQAVAKAKATVQPKATGGYAQSPSAPPRWGPSSTGKSSAQTVEDLIDVTLDDSHEPINLLDGLVDVNLLDNTDSHTALPTVQQGLPVNLLDNIDNRTALPTVQQGLPCIGTSSSLPTTSGFSFVQQQSPQLISQPPTQSAQIGSSAFGFIAGSSDGPKLDLAALYASSEPVKSQAEAPIQPSDSKFSALVNLSGLNGNPTIGAPSKKGADNPTLASLEQSILADLKI